MTRTIDIPTDLRQAQEEHSVNGRRQQPTRWKKDSWARWTALAALTSSLPTPLSRAAVVERAARAHESESAAVAAFVASMVWGYGPIGYGPFRTDRILKRNAEAGRVLRDVAEVARADGPDVAFDALASAPLHYLGPAFGTKYLYFCTAAHRRRHDDRTAPVLDQLVRRWFARHAGVALDGSWSPSNYRRYVALLGEWGGQLDLPADQVEELIFERQRAHDAGRVPVPDSTAVLGPAADAGAALEELRVAVEQIGPEVAERASGLLDAIERVLAGVPSGAGS